MSRNRTEDTLDKQLENRIIELEKALRALTTPQVVGGDIIQISHTAGGMSGPLTLAAGQNGSLGVNFVSPSLTLWNALTSVTIDGTDATHVWSRGSALSTAQKHCRVMTWLDKFSSTDSIVGGTYNGWASRIVWAQIENTDSVPHDFYFHFLGYLFKNSSAES